MDYNVTERTLSIVVCIYSEGDDDLIVGEKYLLDESSISSSLAEVYEIENYFDKGRYNAFVMGRLIGKYPVNWFATEKSINKELLSNLSKFIKNIFSK